MMIHYVLEKNLESELALSLMVWNQQTAYKHGTKNVVATDCLLVVQDRQVGDHVSSLRPSSRSRAYHLFTNSFH